MGGIVAKPIVDISLVGDKALIKGLARFEPRVQKKVVRGALRKSAKRLKAHVIRNLSGDPVKPDSGRYRAGMVAAKIRSLGRSRRLMALGFALPTRAELGIAPGYEWYYPFAVEYGYTRTARAPVTVAPKAPIRRAVNEHATEERLVMGREIGAGIKREAKKAFKKATAA